LNKIYKEHNSIGNYYFDRHIRVKPNWSFILDRESTVGEQLIKFYGNSHISQLGDNVTNYMKNIEIAPNCSLNGLTTTN
jgi:hypothetical protein